MSNTVIVSSNILSAVEWAIATFGKHNFEFELLFPAEKCKFKFQNDRDAAHFALKWI